jgi:hypothetical protein
MEIKKVRPVGILRSQGKEYFLLQAKPLNPPYEPFGDKVKRFKVIPMDEYTITYPRTLVVTDFSVEFELQEYITIFDMDSTTALEILQSEV